MIKKILFFPHPQTTYIHTIIGFPWVFWKMKLKSKKIKFKSNRNQNKIKIKPNNNKTKIIDLLG